MKIGIAVAVAITACTLTACSGESTPQAADTTRETTTATTTYTPPPDETEMEQIRRAMTNKLAPCTEVNTMLTTDCTKAAFYSVQDLTELQDRLGSGFPQTRVAVTELIADLEYWKDNCITSKANSPERRACLPHMIAPGEFDNVAFAYYEDLQPAAR